VMSGAATLQRTTADPAIVPGAAKLFLSSSGAALIPAATQLRRFTGYGLEMRV